MARQYPRELAGNLCIDVSDPHAKGCIVIASLLATVYLIIKVQGNSGNVRRAASPTSLQAPSKKPTISVTRLLRCLRVPVDTARLRS